MFGFGKKKKEEKKRSSLDKIIMGAVIGGAIGSVIGVGLAPQKGSETRKIVAKNTSRLFGGVKEKLKKILRRKESSTSTASVSRKKFEVEDIKKIPHEN